MIDRKHVFAVIVGIAVSGCITAYTPPALSSPVALRPGDPARLLLRVGAKSNPKSKVNDQV